MHKRQMPYSQTTGLKNTNLLILQVIPGKMFSFFGFIKQPYPQERRR